jgi:hypothetical protein
MMTSFIRIGLGAAVALSLLGSPVMAADDAGEAAIIKVCKKEYAKYASRVKKGEVKATLLKNASKLSAECKKAVDGN